MTMVGWALESGPAVDSRSASDIGCLFLGWPLLNFGPYALALLALLVLIVVLMVSIGRWEIVWSLPPKIRRKEDGRQDVASTGADISATQPTWRAKWPNPAESTFNYYRFLKCFESLQGDKPRDLQSSYIAIIGAGIAGLTAARELYRYGYKQIHIFEASSRLGGRLWSEPATLHTAYELGAMRMPFFRETRNVGESPAFGENSVLAFYANQFGLTCCPFPNPGKVESGIYMANEKNGNRQLYTWNQKDLNRLPGDVKAIYDLWKGFEDRFQNAAQSRYAEGDIAWREFWKKVVDNYGDMTFRQLTGTSARNSSDKGDFGGLGMTEKQADIFYVLGAGDGGWGAFYEVSALYVIRTMLFGFGKDLQLILGRGDGKPPPSDPRDSNGQRFNASYMGVQTLAECMLFEPVGGRPSLYESIQSKNGPRLELRKRVREVERKDGGLYLLIQEWGRPAKKRKQRYAAVVLTVPGWAAMRIGFKNFPGPIKTSVSQAIDLSHWISSTKVFFKLKKPFWGDGLPQTVMTDTFLRAMYGYASDNDDRGVLLASYTWEDDANKLVDDDHELARRCLTELDEIFSDKLSGERFSDLFIDLSVPPRIIRWAQEPDYRGCAKLYRSNCSAKDYTLLTFNRECSKPTGVYFAGEAFSVEGGWTEPALRLALDAVIQLVQNQGGEWDPEFQTSYDEFTAYRRDLLAIARNKRPGKTAVLTADRTQ